MLTLERYLRSKILPVVLAITMALPPFANGADISTTEALAESTPDITDVLNRYSDNVLPDLNDPSQAHSFALYLRQRFLGDTSSASAENIKTLADLLNQNPELSKPNPPDVIWTSKEDSFPVRPQLKAFVETFRKGLGRWKAFFYQPKSNIGEWLKSKYEGKDVFTLETLDQYILNTSLIDALEGKVFDPYLVFRIYTDALKTIKPLIPEPYWNLLMAGLIQLTASQSGNISYDIKTNDSVIVLSALGDFIKKRDDLARQVLGCSFDQISLSKSVTKYPLMSQAQVEAEIVALRKDALSFPVGEVISSKRIRALSLVESPFRSCLATDCATDTYFSKALDPNFLYYTIEDGGGDWRGHTTNIVDGEGNWRGHVTVILGEANSNTSKVPVAFVDKVQILDLRNINSHFEGIRQSLAALGYEMVLPIKLGNENGITNYEQTRHAIANLPTFKDSKVIYRSFTPHEHNYDFPNQHSRAYKRLDVKPLLASTNAHDGFQLIASKAPRFLNDNHQGSLWNIIGATFKLKLGSLEDKLKYLEVMETLIRHQLPIDPDFSNQIDSWLQCRACNIRLRYRAMTYILKMSSSKLERYFPLFSVSEIKNLIQNWGQKDDLRAHALKKNVLWRALANQRMAPDLLKYLENELVLSKETWMLFSSESVAKAATLRAKQLIDSSRPYSETAIFGLSLKLLTLMDVAKVAMEQGRNDSVNELETIIFATLEEIGEAYNRLQKNQKNIFATEIASMLKDDRTPTDDIIFSKYIKSKIVKYNKSQATSWLKWAAKYGLPLAVTWVPFLYHLYDPVNYPRGLLPELAIPAGLAAMLTSAMWGVVNYLDAQPGKANVKKQIRQFQNQIVSKLRVPTAPCGNLLEGKK